MLITRHKTSLLFLALGEEEDKDKRKRKMKKKFYQKFSLLYRSYCRT